MRAIPLLVLILLFSCSQQEIKKNPYLVMPDTSDESMSVKGHIHEVINMKDGYYRKQGTWIYFNSSLHLKGYADSGIVAVGFYKNGLKEGTWSIYSPIGKEKYSIRFNNDVPVGVEIPKDTNHIGINFANVWLKSKNDFTGGK